MVLDRLFLWIFTVAVLVGTAGIILQAPTLYDDRQPLDTRLSEIGLATARPMAGVNKHWKLTKKNKKKNKDIPRTFFVAFRRVVSFFYQCLPFFLCVSKGKYPGKRNTHLLEGPYQLKKYIPPWYGCFEYLRILYVYYAYTKKTTKTKHTYTHTHGKKDELQ